MWTARQRLMSFCGLILLTTAFTGLARAESDRKCGYIDKTGTVVIPHQFGSVRDFHEGLAQIGWRGRFIDKTGRVVITPQIELGSASDFHEGLGAVCVATK